MEKYLQDYEFLKELDMSHILDVLAKITILDMNEKPIAEIQGRTLGGQVNITNSSSVRRTGNISFLPDERYSNLMDVNQLISLNKKIKIEIGYLNNTNKYLEYPIFWFPLGVFGITGVSESESAQGHTYSIDFQDKMAFLNGTCGGVIPAAISFDRDLPYEAKVMSASRSSDQASYVLDREIVLERDQSITISGFTSDEGIAFNGTWTMESYVSAGLANDPLNIAQEGEDSVSFTPANAKVTVHSRKLPMYEILMQAISHFGQEQKGNIIIEGVGLRTRELLKWNAKETVTLYIDSTTVPGYENAAGTLTTTLPETENLLASFEPGENIGYEFTNFVFPTDLVVEAGNTVADLLEKIKTTLGNYEYFYDVYGKFHFQEIKNYLNTSLSTEIIQNLTKDDYIIMNSNIYKSDTIYNFDGGDLIINLNHSPNYSEIKNDFVVWGSRKVTEDLELPIRYHLVIDKKPIPTEIIGNKLEDWRNVLYRQGQNATGLGLYSNYYYSALAEEWPKLYNITTNTWHSAVLEQPENIDYFLDFIDTESQLNELEIKNIGRRTKVVNNPSVNCLFAPEIPNYIILKSGDTAGIVEAENQGYKYVIAPLEIYEKIVLGTNYLDAFSVVRELLYQHTQYNSTITLQTLPIYYLDVNRLISIFNQKLNINGKFIINSITLPLSVNETMSINAVAALKRI